MGGKLFAQYFMFVSGFHLSTYCHQMSCVTIRTYGLNYFQNNEVGQKLLS